MAYRIRFLMSWVFTRDMVPGAWHAVADFDAYARDLLMTRFANYNPAMTFTVVSEDPSVGTLADIVWDVDLDGVPGAWHDPQDHIDALMHYFTQNSYTQELTITAVLRHVDKDSDEVKDHADVMMALRASGTPHNPDAYPTFIPAPHPDAPEYNEVFLQDGFWWWNSNNVIPGIDFAGPAAGPEPTLIFTPWTDTTRADLFAAFKAKMDAEFPVTR